MQLQELEFSRRENSKKKQTWQIHYSTIMPGTVFLPKYTRLWWTPVAAIEMYWTFMVCMDAPSLFNGVHPRGVYRTYFFINQVFQGTDCICDLFFKIKYISQALPKYFSAWFSSMWCPPDVIKLDFHCCQETFGIVAQAHLEDTNLAEKYTSKGLHFYEIESFKIFISILLHHENDNLEPGWASGSPWTLYAAPDLILCLLFHAKLPDWTAEIQISTR